MHIVVTLKQVHDPNTPRSALRISADGKTLTSLSSALIMNGYDANALEEALRLRDAAGGSISAVSVGPESSKEVLRRAIAMGADRALHVLGGGGLNDDGRAVASLLAAAIRTLDPVDLVLSGRSASDTDAGIAPLLLAGYLGIPGISPAFAMRRDEGGALIIDRITEAGVQRVQLEGPAVVCVSNEINKPRSPSLKGVVAGKRAVIPTLTQATLGLAVLSPVLRLQRLTVPVVPPMQTELIGRASPAESGAALANRLREEGLI